MKTKMKKINYLTGIGLFLLSVAQILPSVASETKKNNSTTEPNLVKQDTSIDAKTEAQASLGTETFATVSPRFGGNYSTEGAGFEEFASFEAFIPVFQSPGKDLTFLEGKLLWATGNGALGGNILLGHRFKSDSDNYLVGGYVSFDSRNTGETVFNQLGAGFESLSENLDFRANVYLPMGNKSVVLASTNPSTFAFRGNALEIDRVQLFQQALTGFDAEVGTKIVSLGSGSLRGYAGLYYYNSENIDGFVGVRGRLVARPNDNLVAGLTLQSDSVFDTRLTFTIGANLSAGGSRKSKNSVLARINESPQRQSNITVDNVLVKDAVAAIDPSTGNPYNFQHVNLGLGNSNGTIESPFGTIQDALNVAKSGDIVYVRSGTNPGEPGFSIPDGVQVISSAVPMEMKTQIGTVKLPFSGSGVLPLIKDTVTLKNNTSLVGFNIANSSGRGIQGINISNIALKNNIITNSARQGIYLDNVTGKVEIADNSINKTQLGSGVRIDNIVGSVDLKITGNRVENAFAAGILTEFYGTATGTVDIYKNIATKNFDDGISVNLGDDSQIIVNISDNNTSKNNSTGMSIFSTEKSQGILNILNNTAIENSSLGIIVVAFDSSKITSNILNNTTNNNIASGIGFQASSDIAGTTNISGNISQQNKVSGIYALFDENSQGLVNITNNTVTQNQDSGIVLYAANNAIATANISKNTASGHTAPDTEGIFIFLGDDSKANVTVSDNIVTGNLRGITSGANDNAQLRITLESNNVTGNLTEGIAITGDSDPLREELGTNQTFAAVRNNNIVGNNTSGQGFGDLSVATFSDGSNICLQARNNTIGTLALADIAAPELGFPFNAEPLEYLAGIIKLELPDASSTNSIKTVNAANAFVWSGTTTPKGNCGFNP
jgi:trimeric autotransporter adhesin